MKAVGGLHLHQDKEEIQELKCKHSEVSDFLVGDTWRDQWDLDFDEIENAEESYEVLLHQDENHIELLNDDIYLGAVFRKKKISVLYTVNRSQKFPFCSNCVKQRCKCFKVLVDGIEEEFGRLREIDPTLDLKKYWEIYRTERPAPVQHYDHNPDVFMSYG